MTPQEKSALVDKLRERQEALRLDIEREQAKRDGDLARVEVADAGDASVEDLAAHLVDAEIARDVQELRAIADALKRAQTNAFGICATCSEPIPLPRLEAEPQALRCRPCQETYDRLHADGARGPTL